MNLFSVSFLHQISSYNHMLSCFFAVVISHVLHQRSITSSRVGSKSCTFSAVPPVSSVLCTQFSVGA